MTGRIRIFLVAAILLAAAADVPTPIIAAPKQAPENGSEQSQKSRGGAGNAEKRNNLYLVQMAESPVGSYAGGVAGLPPTRPGRGQKIDPDRASVQGYAGYLSGRHDEALSRIGGGRKVYDYRYSFNGFAVALTDAQAAALRGAPGVVNVTKDTLQNADTSNTPTFLGLDANDGLWTRLGIDRAGEDVVIGIIDSGIWPESESFSDRTGTNG